MTTLNHSKAYWKMNWCGSLGMTQFCSNTPLHLHFHVNHNHIIKTNGQGKPLYSFLLACKFLNNHSSNAIPSGINLSSTRKPFQMATQRERERTILKYVSNIFRRISTSRAWRILSDSSFLHLYISK